MLSTTCTIVQHNTATTTPKAHHALLIKERRTDTQKRIELGAGAAVAAAATC